MLYRQTRSHQRVWDKTMATSLRIAPLREYSCHPVDARLARYGEEARNFMSTGAMGGRLNFCPRRATLMHVAIKRNEKKKKKNEKNYHYCVFFPFACASLPLRMYTSSAEPAVRAQKSNTYSILRLCSSCFPAPPYVMGGGIS